MIERLQSLANRLVVRGNQLATKSIYYGKVTAEVSKQIYAKEGLKPPIVNEFKSTYCKLYKQGLQYFNKPSEIMICAKNIKKPDALKYGSYLVQFLGFYSVGEIIGRRKFIGYKNYEHNAKAAH